MWMATVMPFREGGIVELLDVQVELRMVDRDVLSQLAGVPEPQLAVRALIDVHVHLLPSMLRRGGP
jgi:hypothetical protein